MKEMIEFYELNAAYHKKPVLWNISTKIPAGKVVGLIGPNGAGKSTLIKTVLGIEKPLSGCVKIDGIERSKSARKIAYVGQRSEVDWDFPITVEEVAVMGLVGQLGMWKRPKKKDKERVIGILKKLGLDKLADRQIGELSGGQQRRLFVARALLQEADIYLLDEPFAGIDLGTEKLLMEIFHSLAKEGKTVVVVHHDLTQVRKYFTYLILLNIHLIAAGPVDEVFNYENFKIAFGDQADILKEALELTGSKKEGE